MLRVAGYELETLRNDGKTVTSYGLKHNKHKQLKKLK